MSGMNGVPPLEAHEVSRFGATVSAVAATLEQAGIVCRVEAVAGEERIIFREDLSVAEQDRTRNVIAATLVAAGRVMRGEPVAAVSAAEGADYRFVSDEHRGSGTFADGNFEAFQC